MQRTGDTLRAGVADEQHETFDVITFVGRVPTAPSTGRRCDINAISNSPAFPLASIDCEEEAK